MELWVFVAVGVVLGLLFGSFLNVCIVRVPRGESIVSPASHCLTCNHPIRWFDNLPIVSWIVLRGRCRDCATAISWRYCAVELAVALWFGWLGSVIFSYAVGNGSVRYPWNFWVFSVIGIAILGWLLVGLIVTDWQLQRLPDSFTLGGIAAAMFLICVQAIFLGPTDDQVVLNSTHQLRLSSPGSFAAHGNVFLTGPENLIFGRLLAICGAALILLLVRWLYQALRKRDGLGLGDVKMLAMIAAFLGFWPAVLTLFFGVTLACAWAFWLLLRGKAGALTRLPLGSFLGIAGLMVAVIGNNVIAWYKSLL